MSTLASDPELSRNTQPIDIFDYMRQKIAENETIGGPAVEIVGGSLTLPDGRLTTIEFPEIYSLGAITAHAERYYNATVSITSYVDLAIRHLEESIRTGAEIPGEYRLLSFKDEVLKILGRRIDSKEKIAADTTEKVLSELRETPDCLTKEHFEYDIPDLGKLVIKRALGPGFRIFDIDCLQPIVEE